MKIIYIAKRIPLLIAWLFATSALTAQHNHELYNDGAEIHIQAGAEVHVWGDVHMHKSTGKLHNDGLIKMQGNAYSDDLFQQTGTGTFRVENSDVNQTERQFISGSYAVRGGQNQIGIDDGSFYSLELGNDQGVVYLVGAGNIADVRGNVDFNINSTVNRILTHDVGLTGNITNPANGSNYTGIFGLMNSTAGLNNLIDNTISTNGNLSATDNGYIQGKFRRSIDPTGGIYEYVVGLEPAGVSAQRGVQYMNLDIDANDYDVIETYFETGLSNAMAIQSECSGYDIDYFGGGAHGQWAVTNTGTGDYAVRVWPQDDNFSSQTVWLITKDNSIQGTADDCGSTTIGLDRSGLNGAGTFGIAGGSVILSVEFLYFYAKKVEKDVQLSWETATEINNDYFDIEWSIDGISFEKIGQLKGAETTTEIQSYDFLHNNPMKGYNYYRLKQTDFDGQYEYSDIVNILFDATSKEVQIYPNPVTDELNIIDGKGQATIYNLLGQLIRVFSVPTTSFKVNTDDLPKGQYILSIRNETGQVTNKKFIK